MAARYTDENHDHASIENPDGSTTSGPSGMIENLAAERGMTVDDYVDPRTPQQIYDEQVLIPLDRQVLKDAARMVEDFYDALVDQLPQSLKDKHGPLMAERKAKRAARP
jgi:hypothetical protein